jgi:hypothetical protein
MVFRSKWDWGFARTRLLFVTQHSFQLISIKDTVLCDKAVGLNQYDPWTHTTLVLLLLDVLTKWLCQALA